MKTAFPNAFDFRNTMARYNRQAVSMPSLPLELVCNILSYLDCLDLVQCQYVSRVFRKLIVETSLLNYIIELHKNGMVSVVSKKDTSTYASRLHLLRERERNWRMLGWRRRCTINLPPTGSLYEFVGGVYANGREGENRVTASISFLELPSIGIPTDGKEGTILASLQSWTHVMPDFNIVDFTMDPVQDLLVLVVVAPPESPHVYDLHIRSLKTNQPHPKAPRSVFPCLPKPGNHPQAIEVVTAVRVQVCGDLVALLIKEVFDNSGGYLEIWNWHHGPGQSCKMPRTHGIDDFTFLTHDVCLIVRPTGRFEVYDFIDPRIQSSEPTMRYAFAFPPLSNGYTYWYISLSSNPTPGYVPTPEEHSNMEGFLKGHQQIHYPNPGERVHACCLYVFNPADPVLQAVSSFVFFIKIDCLLNPPYTWFTDEPIDEDDPPIPYYNPEAWIKRREADGLPIERLPPPTRPMSFSDLRGFGARAPLSGDPTLSTIDLPLQNLPPAPTSSPPSTSQPVPPPPSQDLASSSSTTTASGSQFVPLSADILNSIPTFTPPQTQTQTDTESESEASTEPATPEPFDPMACQPVVWNTWGPPNTRWFEECLSTDWQHAIYGSRAIESVEISRMAHERPFNINEWPPGRSHQFAYAGGSSIVSEAHEPWEGSEASLSSSSVAASGSGSAPSMATATAPVTNLSTTTTAASDTTGEEEGPKRERRFLRLRDFSTYAQTRTARKEAKDHPVLQGRGKCRAVWREPKLVKEPSRVYVKGVFKEDIMSALPYVETVTDETYDVTDVMMDDCRLLLLQEDG
ncbi:hypothetical protein CC1G_07725 [Coprinopsis cinerea okayama7|uniref:F-box domain-containing protein n=1 Tax=Coprinopsis cinerea (strain Okayama-7 / 130 / ATCC MYA-4618 / FGSC 9003) TaxID=240176 RepID=A8NBX8_COPC7|nr:hypothetical protein CC1G_07725 [Coprinopsis cinerea okayama7\|eukprot:XP_001832338.2 hypothetical protein CC1G_07725 [Coprinopsis cinerea okayama7\